MKALAGRPEDRHPDMAAFRDALAGRESRLVPRFVLAGAAVLAVAAGAAARSAFGQSGTARTGPPGGTESRSEPPQGVRQAAEASLEKAEPQKRWVAARAALKEAAARQDQWRRTVGGLPVGTWPPAGVQATAAAAKAEECLAAGDLAGAIERADEATRVFAAASAELVPQLQVHAAELINQCDTGPQR